MSKKTHDLEYAQTIRRMVTLDLFTGEHIETGSERYERASSASRPLVACW